LLLVCCACSTLLTTEECLLHPNRNPTLSKDDIEARLKRFTGVTKVIWLPK
jgi:agmatine deiminase